ncbi:MAG: hypothetical protein ACXVC6_11385 [Bacteroidia bacterium]
MKGLYFENHSSKKQEKAESATIKSFYNKEKNASNTEKKEAETITASAKPIIKTEATEIKEPAAVNPVVLFENCDTLYFRDGTVIAAKIIELNSKEIKYRYCSGTETEVMRVVLKTNVEQVVYSNGLKETFEKPIPVAYNNVRAQEPVSKKTNGFSAGGFILSILSIPVFLFLIFLFALSSIFGPGDSTLLLYNAFTLVPGFILSIVGLAQINNRRDKFKGMGLSIAALIICSILLILILGIAFT